MLVSLISDCFEECLVILQSHIWILLALVWGVALFLRHGVDSISQVFKGFCSLQTRTGGIDTGSC